MTPPRLLIVRGCVTTDDLQSLGLPMAERYDKADIVALVNNQGVGMLVKGAGSSQPIVKGTEYVEPTLVEFIDADPVAGRCQRAVDSVFRAAELKSGVPQYIVGMFLYFWPLYFGSVEVVAGGIERGDYANVELAAKLFIETDFGENLSALGNVPGDDTSSDAAGHAADGATGPFLPAEE